MARIIIDISHSSIVLQCTSCGVWYAFADTRDGAHDSAVAHEQRAHPGERDALDARTMYRSRARRAALRNTPPIRRS